MSNNIEFVLGDYGIRAIIKSKWEENYISLLLKKNISELELNDAKGWHGSNVDFLQYFPELKSFTILDFNSTLKSIKAVHYLHNLQSLNISTYCKTPIDFSFFPNLKKCGLEWRKGSETLFESKSLNELFINSYDKSDSSVLNGLINLKDLAILNSPFQNLLGLISLIHLKSLRIANLKKIKSLKGIEALQCLEYLEIQSCKGIHNISEVFKLHKLKRFSLLDSGDIETIKGMEKLSELTAFLFYESTNIVDGDLSPLFNLKNLSKISFQNRKHYTHKREEFGKLFSGIR